MVLQDQCNDLVAGVKLVADLQILPSEDTAAPKGALTTTALVITLLVPDMTVSGILRQRQRCKRPKQLHGVFFHLGQGVEKKPACNFLFRLSLQTNSWQVTSLPVYYSVHAGLHWSRCRLGSSPPQKLSIPESPLDVLVLHITATQAMLHSYCPFNTGCRSRRCLGSKQISDAQPRHSADMPSRRTLPRPSRTGVGLSSFFLTSSPQQLRIVAMQAQPPRLQGETEHGMDSWHVWALKKDLLFYSKHPVIRVPLAEGQPAIARPAQAQGTEINMEHACRDSWTNLMKQAHQKVRTVHQV